MDSDSGTKEIPGKQPAAPATDSLLLRGFRTGNQDAAAQLYRRYVDRLRRLAQKKLSRQLARRIDPEDVVQSVFHCFFKAVSKGKYDQPSGEDLWSLLAVIALNRIRVRESFHRAAKRDVRSTTEIGSSDPSAFMQAKKDDASHVLLRMLITEALEQLPPHHQSVIRLRMEGFEVAEIAKQVARTKRTVERILQEARAQLRVLLDEEESHDQSTGFPEVAGD